MDNTFRPQETNLNSYQEIETTLHTAFRKAGFSDDQAQAVAHTFTQYSLGYYTLSGAAKRLLDAGLSDIVVKNLLSLFQEAGRASRSRIEPAAYVVNDRQRPTIAAD